MEKDNEQTQVQLQFNEYPSIELSTRDKFIKMIREEQHDKPEILWVASEKIHGSNFSIHYSGVEKVARYGRRTDFLSKEIPVPCENPGDYMTESFFDARNTVKKFHNDLHHIYEKCNEKFPGTQVIQIYGEYFGGLWPQDHPDYVKGPKSVQKGIQYTPNHQFMVFDIKITRIDKESGQKKVFWVDVTDIPELLDGKIMFVPIYAKGNFEEVYAINTVIDSTIPELLGLKKLEKNIIEGMVLRPNRNISSEKFGERVILKKKNAEFSEVVSKPKAGKEKKEKEVDPAVVPFLDVLSQYINFNRIESVTSKFPDVKDRNKLKNEVAVDVMKDAEKDEYKQPESEELAKKVKLEFEKLVMKEINSYFVKH